MRQANINMRVSEQEKTLLQYAAEVAGFRNLTNFIMTLARREAVRVLNDANTSYLSAEAFSKVNDLIAEPPEPNDELKRLMQHDVTIAEKS